MHLREKSAEKMALRNRDSEAVQLSERDKCLVKILLAFESHPELKGFTKIDSLAHADAMPKLRFYLSGNHISVVAFAL